MNKKEDIKGSSGGRTGTADFNNKHNTAESSQPLVNPLQCFMSGIGVDVGRQLFEAGKIRGEYAMRCAAIQRDVSDDLQSQTRVHIREDIRKRQNALGKIVVDNVLQKRSNDEKKLKQQGKEPAPKHHNPQKTNPTVNKIGKISKIAGKGLGLTAVASEAYNVYNAPAEERLNEFVRAGARLGGGTGAGMVAGAALGAMGCNPITVVAGSVAGGIAGSVGGEALVNAFLNHK